MATYRAVVSYADCEGKTHRHLVKDIKAYNMLAAVDLAVGDFVDSHPATEIGKIVVERDVSDRAKMDDAVYRGS